jgi:hypothetical protein
MVSLEGPHRPQHMHRIGRDTLKKSNGNINVLHVLRFLPLFSGAVADVFLIRTGKNVASASQFGVIYVYINCIMFHRAFPILNSD